MRAAAVRIGCLEVTGRDGRFYVIVWAVSADGGLLGVRVIDAEE